MKLEEGFFGKLEMWTMADGESHGIRGPKGASVMSGNTYYTGYMQRIMQSEYKVALSRRDCTGVMVK